MVFDHQVQAYHEQFMECYGVVFTIIFTYQKDRGNCNSHVCYFHTLQNTLESGKESRIVQID